MKKFIIGFAILGLVAMFPVSSFAGHGHHGNVNIHNTTINDHSTNASANVDASAIANPSAGANASNGNQSVTVVNPDKTTVDNNGHGYRGFAIAPDIMYPGMPGYFGNAPRNANEQPVKAILMYKNTFTRSQICQMLNQSMAKDKDANDTITLVVAPPAKDTVTQVGLITMKASNTDTGSKVVVFKAALSAMNMGANVLLFTAEGAGRQIEAFGWGVGLAYTQARMSSGENESGLGTGGMGIAGGHASNGSLPWVQGIALHTK